VSDHREPRRPRLAAWREWVDDRFPGPGSSALVATVALVLVLGTGVAALAAWGEPFGGADDAMTAAELPSDDAPTAPLTTSGTPTPTESTDPTGTPSSGPSKEKKQERALEKARRKRESALADLAEKMAEQARVVDPAVFRTATLNVLGDSHTGSRGNKPGYASGSTRMGGAVALLRNHDVDVVALQEFESVQKGAFSRIAGGTWDYYVANSRARDAVAWREDTWELLEAGTRNIPYFRGNPAPMPWVLLKHRETGREVYFISLHNPTSNAQRGNNAGNRIAAMNIQVALSQELNASGRPVVLMGDFNERGEAFCRITAGGLIAANGGTASPCIPPSGAGIDWIFATPEVGFSEYARIGAGGVTDHPLIVATATYDDPLPEGVTP
jgi:hypothetical protein